MVTPTRTPTSSGRKPIPLSSYRLWQETLESALRGVTVHPVKTAQYCIVMKSIYSIKNKSANIPDKKYLLSIQIIRGKYYKRGYLII
jgi:hypothetical protein